MRRGGISLVTNGWTVVTNGWTVVTADGRRSRYFEHTVAITAAGPRVLTRRGSELISG